MSESGYEQLPHTADLKIRAWAPDLRGLIEQAARAMIDLMVHGRPQPAEQVEVSAQGHDAEETLVDCLREMLMLQELKGLLPVSAEVAQADERSATCRLGVVKVSDAPELQDADIKAVTYHGLDIRRERDRLVVEVVFDV